MPDSILLAHSLGEVLLYLRVTPCGSCGAGLIFPGSPSVVDRMAVEVEFVTSCAQCDAQKAVRFRVPELPKDHESSIDGPISLSEEASSILDVSQWITLCHVLLEEAGLLSDKVQARKRKIQAARCLEEAIKFFDEVDNDLPPPDAFFHESSKRQFKDRPELFSKSKLIDLRATLPTDSSRRGGASE